MALIELVDWRFHVLGFIPVGRCRTGGQVKPRVRRPLRWIGRVKPCGRRTVLRLEVSRALPSAGWVHTGSGWPAEQREARGRHGYSGATRAGGRPIP